MPSDLPSQLYLRQREQLRRLYRSMIFGVLTVILFAIIIVIAAVIPAYIEYRRAAQDPDSLPKRIDSLSKSLKNSATLITEIEREILRRQELLEQLKKDAETAKHLAELSSPQAQAVAQALRLEFEREQTRSFWTSVLQNFAFAILGVFLAELWRYLRRRIAR